MNVTGVTEGGQREKEEEEERKRWDQKLQLCVFSVFQLSALYEYYHHLLTVNITYI